MVVHRKQPIVPPMSRSASSQPVPTRKRTRVTNAVNTVQAPLAHEPTPSDPSPRKPKGHRKTAKKKQSKSFIDYLFWIAFSTFALYAYYTCRQSSAPPSLYHPRQPLCHALSTFQTHVLEPFVLPPIKFASSYTQKVSEPYVVDAHARLSPYFEPARRTVNVLSPYINFALRTTQRLWRNTLVPLYTKTLKPYYNTALVPRYNRYIHPRLVPLQAKAEKYFAYYVSNPIRAQTNLVLQHLLRFYIFHVDPYARVVRPAVHKARKMITHLALGFSRTYINRLHPLLLNTWARIYPISHTIWKQLVVLLSRFFNSLVAFVKKAAKEAGIARRQYVDPHVDRIFEQVDSKGNGFVKSAEIQTPSVTSLASSKRSQLVLPSVEMVPIPTKAVVDLPTGQDQKPEAHRHDISSATEVSDAWVTPTPVKDHMAETSIHHENGVHGHVTGMLVSSTEFTESVETSIGDPGCAACAAAAMVDDTPSFLNQDNQDAELQEFLRDLGVGEQSNEAPNLPEEDKAIEDEDEQPVTAPVRTDEERRVEVAAKRADIVRRHERWFEKLYTDVEEKGVELAKTLQILRDKAAEKIKSMGRAASEDKHKVENSKSLIGVEQDGQRLLRGLEVYLRKAETRSADWKNPKDSPKDDDSINVKQGFAAREKEKFAELVSKVDAKFSDRVTSFRQAIHQWYVELKEREAQEVLSVSKTIKDLASRAQTDLAMDYAWLDGVTYLDWQRYHELMRIHQKFDERVRQIANGTSTDPESPSDSVVPALDELDKELQDVILGFNYALSGIRSRSLRVFSLRPLTDGGHDEDDDGFFVVRDNERRVVDLRGVDLGKIELKKEAVGVLPVKEGTESMTRSIGILPVPDTQQPKDSKASFDASKIIVGKGKVQIEQALKDIPLEPAAQRHEEL